MKHGPQPANAPAPAPTRSSLVTPQEPSRHAPLEARHPSAERVLSPYEATSQVETWLERTRRRTPARSALDRQAPGTRCPQDEHAGGPNWRFGALHGQIQGKPLVSPVAQPGSSPRQATRGPRPSPGGPRHSPHQATARLVQALHRRWLQPGAPQRCGPQAPTRPCFQSDSPSDQTSPIIPRIYLICSRKKEGPQAQIQANARASGALSPRLRIPPTHLATTAGAPVYSSPRAGPI